MGVYIPNMSKPKSCGECWALDDKYDYPMCLITQEQRGYDFNVMSKVMNDCPLIEIDEEAIDIAQDIMDGCKRFKERRTDE